MASINLNQRLIIIPLVGAVIVAGAIWFFIASRNRIVSHEFVGSITKVEGSLIYATGVFKSSEHPEITAGDRVVEVQIIIGPDTEFIKTTLIRPTQEELRKTDYIFYPDQLAKEQKNATIEDLLYDMKFYPHPEITVKSSKNIFNKSKITPDQADYRIMAVPEFRSRLGT